MKRDFLIATIAVNLFLCTYGIQAQTQKDSLKALKKVNYELAEEALKTKSFGVQADYIRRINGPLISLNHSNHSFIGFEDDKLILQGVFAGARHVCDVSNYIYKADKKGNVSVSLEYKGRILSGKMTIEMKSGDNYAEIFHTQRASFQGDQFTIITGNILPSNKCSYMYIVNEY